MGSHKNPIKKPPLLVFDTQRLIIMLTDNYAWLIFFTFRQNNNSQFKDTFHETFSALWDLTVVQNYHDIRKYKCDFGIPGVDQIFRDFRKLALKP